ncbi:MAG: hypothetical protein HY821_10170 [Acidobacteria bacterium]|nr:hypothetical protein [Acidobacteriota bacterium]
MATRSHSTFNKRQKEMARLEKRQEKEARRLQRKDQKISPDSPEALGSIEEFLPDPENTPQSSQADGSR